MFVQCVEFGCGGDEGRQEDGGHLAEFVGEFDADGVEAGQLKIAQHNGDYEDVCVEHDQVG